MVNNRYWFWEKALSNEFCNSVLAELDWASAASATIQANEALMVDPNIKIADVIWQDPMQPLGCIARCYIDSANQQAGWNYAFSEQGATGISRYSVTEDGYYDWYMDAGPPKNGIQRKLSCVILLNDPSEFEGGVLQFKGMEDQNVLMNKGSVIVFPSFIEYKVTPVTKGVRYTAVSWASGPSFR